MMQRNKANRRQHAAQLMEVPLAAGRRLAFLEYGGPSGRPVIFCHGWPSSGTMAELTDAAARQLGVRIISPDRPGISGSAPAIERRLLEWPPVAERLADYLELTDFRMLAISGGA